MRPVVIAGPTASGKSALALAVAERDGGWVINADALQVYACWRVLTARPDAASLARAPHRLYGHVPQAARHSVGAWLRDAAGVLAEARAAGARPVFVGGSGLYLSALTEGLAPIPAIPAAVRRRSQTRLLAGDLDGLLADLARDDPATLAQIDRRNPARVQRAWEVLTATGRGLAHWRRAEAPPLIPADTAETVILALNKSFSDSGIERRFHMMLEGGALQECAAFLATGGDLALPSSRALGAAALVAHIEGRLTLAEAAAAAIGATRRYAKRQRTWFRNRMGGWPTLDPTEGCLLARIPRA